MKESKGIRTKGIVTDVRGDRTTWHPPGLRNLLHLKNFFEGSFFFYLRQRVLMAQECPVKFPVLKSSENSSFDVG